MYVSISCLRISPFCFADITSEDSKVLIPSFSAAIAKESLVLVEGSSNYKRAKESIFSDLNSRLLVFSIRFSKWFLFTS